MKHPLDASGLQRFASGLASREEGKALLAHLLRGCSDCAAKLRDLMGPPERVAGSTFPLGALKRNRLADHLISRRGAKGGV
jgi:hypothetical protein